MTERERVLKILKGETPDQVPWFADLDYWYNGMAYNKTLDAKYEGDGYFLLNRDMGAGFYLQGYFPFREVHASVRISEQNDGGAKTTTVETPLGVMTETSVFLRDSVSWGYTKHLVENARDLDAFRYYIEHTSYEPDYGRAEARRKLVGDNGVILCYLPRSPFMQLFTTYMGLESICYLSADEPERMEALFAALGAKHDEAAALAVASPAECLMIPENLSSEAIGRRYYLDYLRPYEQKWIKRIANAGKYSFIHMDGTLRGLLREVCGTGFTVIEAMTPEPVGDVPIEDFSSYASGSRPVFWGGIPGVYFTRHVDDAEFDRFVIRVLGVMTASPRYVLGVADQVPPDAMARRVARVRELVDRYGRY